MARFHRFCVVVVGVAILLSGQAEAQQQGVSAKSPDNRLVASASDKVIQVADAQTNKLVMKILAHKVAIAALAYSPDGKLLASADKDGAVYLFDAATGKAMWQAKANPGVNKLEFSKDGRKLEAKAPGSTRTFDPATGKEVK